MSNGHPLGLHCNNYPVPDLFIYVRQDDCNGLSGCLAQSSGPTTSAVDVDLMDENGNTPLLVAARLGHKNCFSVLLQHGADALHVNRMGSSPV